MKTKALISLLSFTLLLTFTLPTDSAFSQSPLDHSGFSKFLSLVVNESGEVSYQKAEEHKELLREYLTMLSNFDLNAYQGLSREDKLALWVNLYHAGLINIILEHYPINSVNDIPGIWEVSLVQMAGKGYSLNSIREEKLMRAFRDEKIHLAIACGAKSCPGFLQEAYSGEQVEGQLYLSTREFVNNPKYTDIVPGQKSIKLSRLFKWYASDFKLDFGTPDNDRKLKPEEAAVLSFVAYYLDDDQKVEFLETGKYKVKYLPFDWALNEWKSETPSSAIS